MKTEQLDKIKDQFAAYAHSFFDEVDEKQQALMDLKLKHTYFVADLAREIAERSGWSEEECNCAEAVGILHDTGRFSQIRDFSTFHDKATVCHGERGYEEAKTHGLCNHLDAERIPAMLNSVRYHNRRFLPEGLPEEHYKYLNIVRDADRLDIYRVVNRALKNGDNDKHPEITRGITQEKRVTPALIEAVQRQEQVDYDLVQTLADRMLLQLSWLHIMTHKATLQVFEERGYLDIMTEYLPETPEITAIIENIRQLLKTANQGS